MHKFKLMPSFLSAALDISADLTELGRTPVAVVCAGVKSILDIGRTLEYLVSLGSVRPELLRTVFQKKNVQNFFMIPFPKHDRNQEI